MCENNFPRIDLVETGKRIRKLRRERQITVTQIQEYMGFTSPQAIYKWQRGQTLPTLDNIVALSMLFQTNIEGILVLEDGMSFSYIMSDPSYEKIAA